MAQPERPQIYLITPGAVDLAEFPPLFQAVLDVTPIACVRLALSSTDEDHILRVADTLRELTHARDIPLLVDSHVMLVQRLGLDGVHLGDGARSVRQARKTLGADAIVGAYCGTSRHDGLNAAEAGADYISFGPVGTSALGDGSTVEPDLFSWWSEVVEIPVVAEGGLDEDSLATLAPITDFVVLGSEVWGADDPAKRLAELAACLG